MALRGGVQAREQAPGAPLAGLCVLASLPPPLQHLQLPLVLSVYEGPFLHQPLCVLLLPPGMGCPWLPPGQPTV